MSSRMMCAVMSLGAIACATFVGADSQSTDHFDVWNYRAPLSWKADRSGDHVTYTQLTETGYCQLALYAARRATTDAASETRAEWKDLVERMFATADVKTLAARSTPNTLAYTTTSARLTQNKLTSFGVLYMIATGRLVTSVLVLSNSEAAMAQCARPATDFLDSLMLDPAAPATPSATAAPATGLVGRWAASTADFSVIATGTSTGSAIRQYVFDAAGGYAFHLEGWGGSFRADEWYLVDEKGAYSVAGDRLTVAPASVVATLRGKQEIRKTSTLPGEKVTYTWSVHYFAGLRENQLVLHPSAKTTRDGEFASNGMFPSSYLYSAKYQPTWQFPF